MCIQSATKLFGYWASEAAKQWTDSFLEDLKKAVDIMIEQMGQFASSNQIEVQERVSDEDRSDQGFAKLINSFL